MSQYKITIITASYNAKKTIRQTIESVASQTYPNIEYVVIDGGSNDGTVDILREYTDKISFWTSEADSGIYDAFNKGVTHATGDFIQFLGADDCLVDDKIIEIVADELADGIDVLSATAWAVDERSGLQHHLTNAHAVDKKNFNGMMIPHPGMFVRKKILEKYPFDISYKIAADYLFFLTCYYDVSVKFKYTGFPVVFFSNQGISSGQSKILMEETNRVRRLFKLHSETLENDGIIKKKIKVIFRKMGIFDDVRYFINRYIRKTWIPHHCDWEICRWCHHD